MFCTPKTKTIIYNCITMERYSFMERTRNTDLLELRNLRFTRSSMRDVR